MKRLLAFILSIGLVGSLLSVSGAAAPVFTDILNHWAKVSIDEAVTKGYVSGYPDGTFQPNKEVTRAEFIKMVVDALKLPHVQQGSPWYQPYVAAALEFDILKETDFNSNWNLPLTRMEMVRIAIRGTDQEAQEVLSDGQFLYQATKTGILHGMANGELNQEGTTTRAQAIAVIERILTLKQGGTLPADQRAISYGEVEATGTNIQTIWGVPAKTLPMKVDLGSKLDITIDKLLILDMEDPNRPYKDLFPKIMMDTGEIADHHYVMAMHVDIKNNNMKDHAIWDFQFKTTGTSFDFVYRTAYISPDQGGNTSVNYIPSFFLDQTEKAQGWLMVAVSKETIESDAKYKEVFFYELVHQKRVYLTPQE